MTPEKLLKLAKLADDYVKEVNIGMSPVWHLAVLAKAAGEELEALSAQFAAQDAAHSAEVDELLKRWSFAVEKQAELETVVYEQEKEAESKVSAALEERRGTPSVADRPDGVGQVEATQGIEGQAIAQDAARGDRQKAMTGFMARLVADTSSLCRKCGGNGVLKIPGGVSSCDRCDGHCYEPVTPPNPDPRCPKCGFTMCELFDEKQVTSLATIATPNGRYQCYHCTPIQRIAPPTQTGAPGGAGG